MGFAPTKSPGKNDLFHGATCEIRNLCKKICSRVVLTELLFLCQTGIDITRARVGEGMPCGVVNDGNMDFFK